MIEAGNQKIASALVGDIAWEKIQDSGDFIKERHGNVADLAGFPIFITKFIPNNALIFLDSNGIVIKIFYL